MLACQTIVSKSVLTFSFREVDIKCAIFIIFLTFITCAQLLAPIRLQLTVKLTLSLSLSLPYSARQLQESLPAGGGAAQAEPLPEFPGGHRERAEDALHIAQGKSPSTVQWKPAKANIALTQQAHYLRALALSGLGRLEEALFNGFLAICLDKNTNLSNSEIFQHDLAKVS